MHSDSDKEVLSDSEANRKIRDVLQGDPAEPPEGFFQARRWWFTSTAFPLLAGAFGPLANLMSLCGVTQTWIQLVPSNEDDLGQSLSDPTWLVTIKWLSFALAAKANIILLLNFSKRIPYIFGQTLTILFLYTSSILLITGLCLASRDISAPGELRVYSQAFFYSMIAAIHFFSIACLLLSNTLGAYGFKAYPPTFNTLTLPQRTLMLQNIFFVIYLSLGALVFAKIEDWAFVDSVYWADYTLLTVGIGSDFPFKRNLSRALLIPYAFGGIMTLGLVIASIRSLLLDRGKIKVVRRSIQKERERLIGQMRYPAEKWKQEEFEAMQQIQAHGEWTRKRLQLGFSLLAFLILWFLGALVFMVTERKTQNWTYFRSFYFAYTTLTTIGYGDFWPESNSGKPFFVIWSLLAVPTVTILISNIGEIAVGWFKLFVLWLGHLSVLHKRESASGSGGFAAVSWLSLKKLKGSRKAAHERSKVRSQPLSKVGEVIQAPEEQPSEEGSLVARIAREIKALSKDMNLPDKSYTWEEWNRWLKLLGEKPFGKFEKNAMAYNQDRTEEQRKGETWTWLSDDGPLFSTDTQTEWVLRRLCERLEEIGDSNTGKDEALG